MIQKNEVQLIMPDNRVWRGIFRNAAPVLRNTRYVYTAQNLRLSKVGSFLVRKGSKQVTANSFVTGPYKDFVICGGYDSDGIEQIRGIAAYTNKVFVTSPNINDGLINESVIEGGDFSTFSILPLGMVTYLVCKNSSTKKNTFHISNTDTSFGYDDRKYPWYDGTGGSAATNYLRAFTFKAVPILKSGKLGRTTNRTYYETFIPENHGNVQGYSAIQPIGTLLITDGADDPNIDSYLYFFALAGVGSQSLMNGTLAGAKTRPTYLFLGQAGSQYVVGINDEDEIVAGTYTTTTEEEVYAEYGLSSGTLFNPPNSNSSIYFQDRVWHGGCIVQREQPNQDDFVFYEGVYFGEVTSVLRVGSGGTQNSLWDGYTIGVAFRYADGKESRIVSTTISTLYGTNIVGQKATLITIPTPCSGDVASIVFYRGSTSALVRECASLSVDTFALYGADVIIDLLQNNGTETRNTDNSDGKYEDTYNFKNTVFWSDVGCPTSIGINSREDFGSPADSITAIFGFENNLYVFKQSEVWLARITGNTYPIAFKKKISDSFGCIDKNSIIEAGRYIYFLSDNTLCSINGDSVEPFGREELGTLLTDLLDDDFVGCHGVYNDTQNEIWFTVCNQSATNNGRTFVYNIDVKAWTYYNYARAAMDKLPNTNLFSVQYGETGVILSEDSQVNKDLWGTVTGSQAASSIDWIIDTGFVGQTNPFAEKVVRYVSVDAKNITVDAQYDTEGDEGANTGDVITLTADGSERLDFVYPMDASNRSRFPKIRFSGSTDTNSTNIGELSTVNYRYQERMQVGKSGN